MASKKIEDFSATFIRTRTEMVISSVLCWALVALGLNMNKVPLIGLEITSVAPEGAMYCLVLGFYLYCSVSFVFRYMNEQAYSATFIDDFRVMDEVISGAHRELARLEGISGSETYSSTWEEVERKRGRELNILPAIRQIRLAHEQLAEMRSLLRNTANNITFERVVLAFWLPVIASLYLVIGSLKGGLPLIASGMSYFYHQFPLMSH